MRKVNETSQERIAEIVKFALENGDERACEVYGLKSESLNRYRRVYQNELAPEYKMKAILKRIGEQYTNAELKAIASGGRIVPGYGKVPMVDFEGEKITFAHFTDTHMGAKWFKEPYFDAALEECERESVEFICMTGDLSDGMSNRPDHIYDLTHIGYDRQKDYCVEQWSKWGGKVYMIDGNHDRWFIKSNGAVIVKDVCERLPNAEFLGHDEADISLKGDVVVKLWHGEDGNSYAISYRMQKLAEGITGGEKPHIWLVGHTHKMGYFFIRNIHMISGGALSTQSSWMRRTRKENHTGFWIIKAWIKKNTVTRFSPTFYPFYA